MLQFQTVEPGTLGLLTELQSKLYLSDFVLVGGTAIALHLGHRKSVDLDLFTKTEFDAQQLLNQVGKDFPSVQPEVISTNTLIVKINGVKVDFIRIRHDFHYPVIKNSGITMLSLEDLAPMKLSAVGGRGKKKDFYDVYFMLRKFSISQMLELYANMFEPSSRFHITKSLAYFVDAEGDTAPIVFEKVTWAKVKKYILQEVRKI